MATTTKHKLTLTDWEILAIQKALEMFRERGAVHYASITELLEKVRDA